MKTLLTLIISALATLGVCAQTSTSFQRKYYDTLGTNAYYDYTGVRLKQVSNGDYLYAFLEGGFMRTDDHGKPIWARNFATNPTDLTASFHVRDLCTMANTDILLSGHMGKRIGGPHQTDSFVLMRTNSNGVPKWTKVLPPGNEGFGAYGHRLAANGDIIVICSYGVTTNNVSGVISRLDTSGAVKWQRFYRYYTPVLKSQLYILDISECSNGDLLASGYSTVTGLSGTEAFVMRLNSSGQLQWKKKLSTGTLYDGSSLSAVLELPGGNIRVGVNNVFTNYRTGYLTLDASGNVLGTGKAFSVSGSSVQIEPTGVMIFSDATSLQLLKTNNSGTSIFAKKYVVCGSPYIYMAPYTPTLDGGYALYGGSYNGPVGGSNPGYFIKADASGNAPQSSSITIADTPYINTTTVISEILDSVTSVPLIAISILQLPMAVRDTTCMSSSNVVQWPSLKPTFYPNPVTKALYFERSSSIVKIYSSDGRLLISEKNTRQIDMSQIAQGIYFLRLEGEQGQTVGTYRFLKD